MTRYKARKALSNEGLTVREIPHDDGDGFIIRVMNRPSGVANEATTIVRQPGQEHIAVSTQLLALDKTIASGDWRHTYPPAIDVTPPSTVNGVVSIIGQIITEEGTATTNFRLAYTPRAVMIDRAQRALQLLSSYVDDEELT